jgi:hypothetical protein
MTMWSVRSASFISTPLISRKSRVSTTFHPGQSVRAASPIIAIAAGGGQHRHAVDAVLREIGVARIEAHREQLLAGRERRDRGGADERPERGRRAGAASRARRADRGLVRLPRALAADDLDRPPARPRRRRRRGRRPSAASTSVTPLAANLASVSAVTMPAPNCVGPQGPQQSALTATRPCHWSRSWQQSRFISSLAVA